MGDSIQKVGKEFEELSPIKHADIRPKFHKSHYCLSFLPITIILIILTMPILTCFSYA